MPEGSMHGMEEIMGIIFHEEEQLFQLETLNTEYWIGIADEMYLGHIY